MIFPWHTQLWEPLWRLCKDERLPHALLFAGPAGVGKRQFATSFAGAVLCQNPSALGAVCAKCHACCLIQAHSHPDFRVIAPEEEGHAIKIDQIRELSEFIQKTSHQGGYRVVIIQPATAMNTYAANALLKTLEEPTPNTLIILISDQRASLPMTVISRCQQVRFSIPPRDQALAWLNSTLIMDWSPILEVTQEAPLLALEWTEKGIWPLYQNFMRDLSLLSNQESDPLQLAVQWKEANMLWVFDMFFHWLIKLIRLEHLTVDADQLNSLHIPTHISATFLWEFAEYLQRLRVEALGPFNLNQQLLLESLFIRWAQYASR